MTDFVEMREYRRVVARCEWLEAELAQLRAPGKAEVLPWRHKLGLPPRQAQLVGMLMARDERISTLRIATAMNASEECVRVTMTKLRASLVRKGAPRMIAAAPWGGYLLTQDVREWLRERVPEAFPKAGGKAP